MNPYTINPPQSEVDFEKLCLALLKRHWSRPGLERFAKKGEEQYGVDIFDTHGEDPMYGAQCKLKEQWKSLAPKEIREELEKAKTFPSKLDHYAILTTGKISGDAQLEIQAINREHRASGLFTVELFTWDKLTELIRQYPDIERQFFGGLRPEEVATVNSKLDYVVSLTESVASSSAKTEIDGLIDEARERLTLKEVQIAVSLLNRIQRTKGGELTEWHRFRISTNLGVAHLMLAKGAEAARYFFEAKQLRPDDELAVANEVLAYHLLGVEEQTREKAEAALKRFPNSTRVQSLWIQAAHRIKTYEQLLEATPSHLRGDAEVASALARKAMASGLLDRAIEHAKAAIADKPAWSQTHLLLAQTYFGMIAMVARTTVPLKAEERERNLGNSLAAADAALSAASIEGDANTRAQALALKADIALLQGRKEDASHFAREAFGADPTDLQGRLAMAQMSVSTGNLDEGIRILEEAYVQADYAPHVSYMLGQSLVSRGAETDVRRAIDVFTSAKLENLDRELIDPVIVSATRAFLIAKRFADLESYMARSEVAASPMMVATIKANLFLTQSQEAEAGRSLDEAMAARRPDESRSATDFLARTLMEAGRPVDALPLLQELFKVQTPNFDVGLLLNCAARLKQDQIVLDTCEELHERGVRHWKVVEFESRYLEEYDFRKAIRRLEEFIAANPSQRLPKLRLAIIKTRYGQDQELQISEEILPLPEELPMPYALPVVHLLQWHGLAKLAADYSYRVLRAHYSDIEAHKAYLASLLTGNRPDEIPAIMDQVEVGSAVQYAEASDAPAGWFVIENSEPLNNEFEEISANSEIARELLGKRVGDSFLLSKSPVKDRVGRIVQILSKYTRRFQVVGDQMQLKFGAQSIIQTIRLPSPDQVTAADLQPMLDSVKVRSEAASKLRELYRSNVITLHLYSQRLQHSAHGGLLDLAISEGDFIRCAPAQVEALGSALATLGTKSTIVVDLTALATLQLLGISRQLLTGGAFRFVMTPATFTELQEIRAKSRATTAHDTLYYEKGQHGIAKITAEDSEKQKAVFEEFVGYIQKHVGVVPVPQVATLTPQRRELLENILGHYGLESAQLALSPGHIWWTDDFAAAEIAKSEFGTERVWTQAILEHLGKLGLLERGVVEESYAKLVGFNYQVTHFNGSVIAAALRVSNGSVDGFPMQQILRAFEPAVAGDRRISFGILAEFILRLTFEPTLPETKCIGMKAVLNVFPNDPRTNMQLGAFRSQCAALMALNPLAQADFLRCFDEWNRERLNRKLIVEA